MIRILLCFMFMIAVSSSSAQEIPSKIKHVILISFDGLRPDPILILGSQQVPNFTRLIKEGSFTLNARTDYDYTVTLPNHTCMITGYPVMGLKGHHFTENKSVGKTIHDFAGRRVYSIFDVLRHNHRRSAMLASKLKFIVYQKSFPIDSVSLTDQDDLKTLKSFQKLANEKLPDFVFIHFAGADQVGHHKGWHVRLGSSYMNEIQTLDQYLGKVMEVFDSNADLRSSTVIIVTSDHGGAGLEHSDNKNVKDYTIPFFIWGKPVAKGIDLYTINIDRRKDPKTKRISYSQKDQPIRNGDAANLALSLLELPAVEGSTIGNKKPLKINKD